MGSQALTHFCLLDFLFELGVGLMMILSVMLMTVGRGVEEEEVLQWHVLV